MRWPSRFSRFSLPAVVCAVAAPTNDFIAHAAKNNGEFGDQAARFLVENMPQACKAKLTVEFLIEDFDLALMARATLPWAKEVAEEIFLNDVLP